MKPLLAWTLLVALLTMPCYAQEAQPTTASSTSGVKITFAVTLAKSLDSRKLKEGDSVACVTAGTLHGRNGFLIPSGSKVIGHVTQAHARAKGDAHSTLGIAFDKIQLKGQELSMTGIVQAIAPSLGGSEPTTGPAEPGSLSGAGRGDSGMSPATTPPPTSSVKISGPVTGTPLVNPQSTGILGMKNLAMDANGLITSPGKQVKLDDGTQMMVRAEIQMPVQ